MQETGHVIGIDFGTTNSSIALIQAGQVVEVEFISPLSQSRSSRSLLYLQRQAGGGGGGTVHSWTGAVGVERYLSYAGEEGVQHRLIQSLKSHLAARNLTGTEIFGRQYRFEDLVARILRDLRQWSSDFFGFEVTRAVAGRPVVFVGANSEADDHFALGRLHAAFLQAGFTQVQFAMEPVAAAHTYAASRSHEEIVLIGDFGGGTTDFSLLRLGQPGGPLVLGNSGVPIGGDTFDARIVRRLISPALGSESMVRSLGKVLPALPAWIYTRLEHWHTLSFLRTREVREMLRAAEKRSLEPEKIGALLTLIEEDLGFRLHQAVQQLKIGLSQAERAEFLLDTEALRLREAVSRTQFERWIAPELAHMEQSVDKLLQHAGIPAPAVSRVFLTGGTSLVPAVQRIFHERFGKPRVSSGDAFTSVAQGLAWIAAGETGGTSTS